VTFLQAAASRGEAAELAAVYERTLAVMGLASVWKVSVTRHSLTSGGCYGVSLLRKESACFT
jgi:hypothetical protein